MSDNTPEFIALELLRIVAVVEGKPLAGIATEGETRPDRKWVLDAYAECLEAAQGRRQQPGRRAPRRRTGAGA